MTEQDYRRKDFVGGVPVRMIDGEVWYLAEPRMRLIPSDSDMGFEQCLSLDDDGTFDALTTEYSALLYVPQEQFAECRERFAGLEIKLGRMMLERNYDLPMDVLRTILQISHDKRDVTASEVRAGILRVLAGDSPKPSAGGDEPSPTPADSSSTTAC